MKRALIAIACGCGPSYRTFVAPPASVSPGPASTATDRCSDRTAEIADYEAARERAALDAELRKTGGMLLAVHAERSTIEVKVGAVIRGPANERWLVVGETSDCGEVYQTVAMTAAHEVFVVDAHPQPQRQVRVAVCSPDCRGGCGNQQESRAVVAEVPDDARLGRERDLTFAIDVHVDVDAFAPSGERIPCPKVP
jgi:hypothetical protein